MKLQIITWFENEDIFPNTDAPGSESTFRITYRFEEGRPMKWGATMSDAEPEEPEEVEIDQIDIKVDKDQWADVTKCIGADIITNIETRILEGELS